MWLYQYGRATFSVALLRMPTDRVDRQWAAGCPHQISPRSNVAHAPGAPRALPNCVPVDLHHRPRCLLEADEPTGRVPVVSDLGSLCQPW